MIVWNNNQPGSVLFADQPPLGGRSRERLLAQLRERLRGRVLRAYTFGSFNTPAFRPGSDIDLILVCDAREPFYDRPARFADLYELHSPMDILVYRPEELDALLKNQTGFWRSVAATLQEL